MKVKNAYGDGCEVEYLLKSKTVLGKTMRVKYPSFEIKQVDLDQSISKPLEPHAPYIDINGNLYGTT